MKRSKGIRLILIGGLSAGVLAGCGGKPVISNETVYTNNFYLPGVGYYHAPFRNWYAFPYNHFDPQRMKYYYGGRWESMPFTTITNISSPTVEAAQHAETARTDISRRGFGGTSYGHGFYS